MYGKQTLQAYRNDFDWRACSGHVINQIVVFIIVWFLTNNIIVMVLLSKISPRKLPSLNQCVWKGRAVNQQ